MATRKTTDVLRDAAARAETYLNALGDRPVFPAANDIARLEAALDHPMPDEPTDPEDALAWLDDIGSPATVASAGGRYFGFVTGGALPARPGRQLAGRRVGSEQLRAD